MFQTTNQICIFYPSLIDADALCHRVLDLLTAHLLQDLIDHFFQLAVVWHRKLNTFGNLMKSRIYQCRSKQR